MRRLLLLRLCFCCNLLCCLRAYHIHSWFLHFTCKCVLPLCYLMPAGPYEVPAFHSDFRTVEINQATGLGINPALHSCREVCFYPVEFFQFVLSDVTGFCLVKVVLGLNFCEQAVFLYNYFADVKFNNKDKDWKPLLDKKIEHLRELDGDLYSAFNEASDYYNIFKNYSDEYYFAFNFYEGKIKYVQLVPGLLQKFFDYEIAVNNIDYETYKKYEEYCINEFKTEIKDSNTKADAFNPIVTIPTYKTWIKDKNAEESNDNTALKLRAHYIIAIQ